MKQRNPKATCETCPYWSTERPVRSMAKFDASIMGIDDEDIGCCRRGVYTPRKFSFDWCGEHPDFFVDTIKEAENKLVDIEWEKMRKEYGTK